MLWSKIKTNAQVSRWDPNWRQRLNLFNNFWFFYKNLIRWKTKKPLFFLPAWEADSGTIPSFVANQNAWKILFTWLVFINSNNLTFLIERIMHKLLHRPRKCLVLLCWGKTQRMQLGCTPFSSMPTVYSQIESPFRMQEKNLSSGIN